MPTLPSSFGGQIEHPASEADLPNQRQTDGAAIHINDGSRSQLNPRRTVLPPLPSSPLLDRYSSPHHPSNLSASPQNARSNHWSMPTSLSPNVNQPDFNPPQARTRFPRDQTPGFAIGGEDRYLAAQTVSDPSEPDPYLTFIAETDWSSPSNYPSLTGLPPGGETQFIPALAASSAQGPTQLFQPQEFGANSDHVSPSTSTTYRDHHQASVLDPRITFDAAQNAADMPSTTRRQVAMMKQDERSAKRQRTTNGASASARASSIETTKPKSGLFSDSDSDIFGDSPDRAPSEADGMADGPEAIDLTEADGVPEALKKPEVDNRVKLGSFQCAICMDSVTALTLTHCGHLFCAACLHQSLHVDSTKGKCPMCRSKIEMKSRSAWTARSKGYWPLELKLMTSTRKGKRKAAEL